MTLTTPTHCELAMVRALRPANAPLAGNQKWCLQYKGKEKRGCFYTFVLTSWEIVQPVLAKAWFYSQPRQPPCAWHAVTRPMHTPLQNLSSKWILPINVTKSDNTKWCHWWLKDECNSMYWGWKLWNLDSKPPICWRLAFHQLPAWFSSIEFITIICISYTKDVQINQISVTMNEILTNVSVYCTASKESFYDGV